MRHILFLIASFATYFLANYVGYHYGNIKDIQHLILFGLSIVASICAWFPASVLDSVLVWRANYLAFGVAGALSALIGVGVFAIAVGQYEVPLFLLVPAASGVVCLYGLSRGGATFIRRT